MTKPRRYLVPIDSMKRLCLGSMTEEQYRREHNYKEYKFKSKPRKEFLPLWTSTDCDKLIWITDTAFISFVYLRNAERLPDPYRRCKFDFWADCTDERYPKGIPDQRSFSIYAASFDDALCCLEILENLYDTDLRKASLLCKVGEQPVTLPFSDARLEKMAQQYFNLGFENVIFTAAQGSSLLHCASISLTQCQFDDGGAAIWELCTRVQDGADNKNLEWKNVVISNCVPFDDHHLSLLLNHNKFSKLELSNLRLSLIACQALSDSGIFSLILSRCTHDDGGDSLLIKSVQENRGPQRLTWADNHIDPLLNALKGNTRLSHLELVSFEPDDCNCGNMTCALRENRGLQKLFIVRPLLAPITDVCDRKSWDYLMDTLGRHPALRYVNFHFWNTYGQDEETDAMEKAYRTKALANMLQSNSRIDDVAFNWWTYDQAEWDVSVAPKLEYNKWRKRFLAILENDQQPLIRAALVAKVLSRFHDQPWLVWVLLRLGTEVFLDDSHLDPDQIVSIPPPPLHHDEMTRLAQICLHLQRAIYFLSNPFGNCCRKQMQCE